MSWVSKGLSAAKATVDAAKASVESAKAESAATQNRSTPSVLTVPRQGGFFCEVVGESNYVPAIKGLIGKKGGEQEMWVTLEREPSNRHDRNAIRVHVQGKTVGYVPRHDTGELQGLLQAAERQGIVVMAWGRVWYSGDGSDPHGSVSYDMGEPWQVWPVTAHPDNATSAVWPTGRRLKVTVDDSAKDLAKSLLSRSYVTGHCAAYLRIHRPDEYKRVSVSAEGRLLGVLSPAASTNMDQVLSLAEAAGRDAYVIGEVVGNAVAVEVKILAKPAEELSPAEVASLTAPTGRADWAPPTVTP